MQALAERMDATFGGLVLERIDPLQFSAMKTFDPPADSFFGRTLDKVGRRGKFVVMEFGGPRILLHLSQGGRMDFEDPGKKTRPKGAVTRFWFQGGSAFLVKEYGTQRKAGWWTVGAGEEGPLERLGPDPFSPEFEEFVLTSQETRRIHTVFRDQRTIAGIGRGYTDDILHRARLSPYDSFKKLTEEQRHTLVEVTREVLNDALVQERARTGGLPTKLDNRFTIHRRAGLPCPRCDAELKRVSYEEYEVVYCPTCQTGGKVLADRRMSRLIK